MENEEERRVQGAGRPRVLVVAGRAGKLQVAKDAGFEVVYVQAPQVFTQAHRDGLDEALLLDYTRPERVIPVVAGLHSVAPLDLIVSFTDPGLDLAATLSEQFGLPGNRAAVSAVLRDKHALRRRLAEAGIEHHPCARVRTAADLRAFGDAQGYPLILKPLDGTGSQGVRRIDSPQDADRAFAAETVTDVPLLAERFLTGTEISVETISQHGRHRVIALTRKFIDENFVEKGHVVPAGVGTEDRAAVELLVRGLLDAVGLTEGCAHTEVMLTPDGPVIIESHNRMGGDRIYELVKLSHGTDLERLSYLLPLDREVLPASSPRPQCAAAIWFVRAEPGRVVAVDGEDAATGLPGVCEVVVTAAPGDTVAPVRSSSDRVGYVIATGADSDEALGRARRAATAIVVRTEAAQ
ncbi:ATP-grasp domain-containing protein [Streptomyces sp. NBC_01013]|uniref:ATP-grasp domain-containing protein n=1 Tax=Streptomyces sp. NBC_01013 TaxID=2903718 RepID=UPI00386A51B3|nr:ATP-grasp domain-containing protein [Streptomyces sp. NBC_01013]